MTFRSDPKPPPRPPKERKPLKRTPLKRNYKVTNELALFKKIFYERRGLCEVTGKKLEFNVCSFMHVLPKSHYGRYRLNKDNILLVQSEIHHLYDTSTKERTLQKFPAAEFIYSLKDFLKTQYNNLPK